MIRFETYIEEGIIIPKDSKKVKNILNKGFVTWYRDFRGRNETVIDYSEEFYKLVKNWSDGGLKSMNIWVLSVGTSSSASKLSPISVEDGIVGAVYQPFFNNIKIYVNDKIMMKTIITSIDILKQWEKISKILMNSVNHELVHKGQWASVPNDVRSAALVGLAHSKAKWNEQFGEDYFFQSNEMMAYAQDAAKQIIEYATKNDLDPFNVQRKIQKFITQHGSLFDSKEFSTYAVYLIYGISKQYKKKLNKFHKMVFEYLEQLVK